MLWGSLELGCQLPIKARCTIEYKNYRCPRSIYEALTLFGHLLALSPPASEQVLCSFLYCRGRIQRLRDVVPRCQVPAASASQSWDTSPDLLTRNHSCLGRLWACVFSKEYSLPSFRKCGTTLKLGATVLSFKSARSASVFSLAPARICHMWKVSFPSSTRLLFCRPINFAIFLL